METAFTTIGRSLPIGASVTKDGINFCVYSRGSTGMELLLFDSLEATEPSTIITMAPDLNKTYHYWHVFVPHLKAGQVYGYRAHGPFEPSDGYRFDPEKLLLDPYSQGVWLPPHYDRGAAGVPGDNTATAPKSVVIDTRDYDWENDLRPRNPWTKTVIYEMHVGGFTKNPNSGVAPERRGTYAGVIEKIPYLVDLGVTAVELLPVFQFDPYDAPLGKMNYWGYAPISFFAPHLAYSSEKTPQAAANEFRDMVKALHRAGIEVILDVVYNHTAEGNENGPTLCYRGLSNQDYYVLEKDPRYYSNFSGTGNTLNGNNPVVRRMIVDSLRYWAVEMHVDGFRFDLASILSRDTDGRPLANSPVLWDIETDPGLAGVKLIAEAWDAGGLYQVGSFIGESWNEWNGRFRDDIRDFVAGSEAAIDAFPDRLLASPDIYAHELREPEQSINFITAHDGFTMNDLVSYNEKHNEENGEDNNDGESHNRSWNCGVEGPTDDPAVEGLRERQIKNFFTILLFSMGTPMIVMGDEVRRTQMGNNNVFCQDSEISWFDWSLVEKNQGMFRFVQQLIRRRLHKYPRPDEPDAPLHDVLEGSPVQWHGTTLNQPDWSGASRAIAFTIQDASGANRLHFMANTSDEPQCFELPEVTKEWLRIVDTYLPSPDDIVTDSNAYTVTTPIYCVQPRSIVVLEVHGNDNSILF